MTRAGNGARQTAATIGVGLTGGLALHVIGVPAGALVGSVAAVGCYSVLSGRELALPANMRVVARALIGTVIGSTMTLATVTDIGRGAVWALGATVASLGVGLLCALLVWRTTQLDWGTSVVAFCPGGLAEMAGLSDELRLQSELVLGIHLLRKMLTLVMAAAVVGAVRFGF